MSLQKPSDLRVEPRTTYVCLSPFIYDAVVPADPPPKNYTLVPRGTAKQDSDIDFTIMTKLPCVGREANLQHTVKDMLKLEYWDHEYRTVTMANHIDGTGKSAFAAELPRYIRPRLLDVELVVASVPNVGELNSVFNIWSDFILKQPGMTDLGARINKDMDIRDLVEETSEYLRKHEKVLYLHLDELIPTLPAVRKLLLDKRDLKDIKKYQKDDDNEYFDHILFNLGIMFQFAKRILLFVTGASPLYDPRYYTDNHYYYYTHHTLIHKPHLELLTESNVAEIMKIAVLQVDRNATMTLAEALGCMIVPPESMSKDDAVSMLVSRLHDLSCGVPLLLEKVLYGMLMEIGDGFFSAHNCADSIQLDTLLQMLSIDRVLAMPTVQNMLKTMEKRIQSNIQTATIEELTTAHTDLLRIFVSATDHGSLQYSKYSYSQPWHRGCTDQLVIAATFWGVFHSYDPTTERLRFVLPELLKGMLVERQRELFNRIGKHFPANELVGSTAQDNVLCVQRSLVLDRLSMLEEDRTSPLVCKLMQRRQYREWDKLSNKYEVLLDTTAIRTSWPIIQEFGLKKRFDGADKSLIEKVRERTSRYMSPLPISVVRTSLSVMD